MAYIDGNEVLFSAQVNLLAADGTSLNIDQTYNPQSANAQSGTAVTEAINRIGLFAMYTLEPQSPISDIVEGYTNSFGIEYFNRTPIVGDNFYCFGISNDGVSFHMAAQVTDFVDGGNGKINAAFVALEVVTEKAEQVFDGTSIHAQSGTAVAQALEKLSLGLHTDGLLYVFVNGEPVGEGIALEGGISFENFENGETIILKSNKEYRASSPITTLTLTLPVNSEGTQLIYSDEFMCSFEFDTNESETIAFTLGNFQPYFTGDNCTNGIFTPISGTHYSLLLWYDGIRFHGVSRGVLL